jgi:signal transduction histidine kinase
MLLKKEQLDIQSVAPGAIAKKIINNLQPFASIKNNELINQVSNDCRVLADENTLRFILRNIISNANKFTSNGKIIITSEPADEGRVKISVSDSGCGMTVEILQQLFNPAKRQSREGTNKEKGSGLGLILAKEFAEAMHAQIEVSSKKNEGTVFSVLVGKG